jgi:hypothetical protein
MAITTLNNRSINRSDTAASGQLWTATSATASDFQAVSAGKIGQVLSAIETDASTASPDGTFTNITGLSVAITPAATSSKIWVMYNIHMTANGTNDNFASRIARGGTGIGVADSEGSCVLASAVDGGWNTNTRFSNSSINFLDSPSSTSELTYTVQWISPDSAALYLNKPVDTGTTSNRIRTVSTITVMEVLV